MVRCIDKIISINGIDEYRSILSIHWSQYRSNVDILKLKYRFNVSILWIECIDLMSKYWNMRIDPSYNIESIILYWSIISSIYSYINNIDLLCQQTIISIHWPIYRNLTRNIDLLYKYIKILIRSNKILMIIVM